MPILYIIATPIGNLEDVTLRALRVFKEVDMVLCEDTRMTQKLLQKYNITTPTLSYHSHSGLAKVEKIFKLLEDGKNLALVSDAGTPTISDPGVLLVSQIRKHFKVGPLGSPRSDLCVSVVPIPGPSAVITALSASGLPSSDFLFLGFLPHKKGRETLFKEIALSKRTTVFYESPHRILKTLESLKKHLDEKRRMVIARELTKIYEEMITGTAQEILQYFEKNKDRVKGEFVVMVAPR